MSEREQSLRTIPVLYPTSAHLPVLWLKNVPDEEETGGGGRVAHKGEFAPI